MNAREEILSLINRYAYTVDSGDLDGFAALYDQGEWSIEGQDIFRGAQQLQHNILSDIIIYEDGTPRTRHVTTNIELSFGEGGSTSRARRYVTVLQACDALPLQAIFSGDYHDEFVLINKRWKFARTIVKGPMFGDMSQHLRTLDLATN